MYSQSVVSDRVVFFSFVQTEPGYLTAALPPEDEEEDDEEDDEDEEGDEEDDGEEDEED